MFKTLTVTMFMLWVSTNSSTASWWSKLTPLPAKNFKQVPTAYYKAYIFQPLMYGVYGFNTSWVGMWNLNDTKMQELTAKLSNFYYGDGLHASNKNLKSLHRVLDNKNSLPTVAEKKDVSNNKTFALTHNLEHLQGVAIVGKKTNHKQHEEEIKQTSKFLACMASVSRSVASEEPKKLIH